jgi:hypothetical protein
LVILLKTSVLRGSYVEDRNRLRTSLQAHTQRPVQPPLRATFQKPERILTLVRGECKSSFSDRHRPGRIDTKIAAADENVAGFARIQTIAGSTTMGLLPS